MTSRCCNNKTLGPIHLDTHCRETIQDQYALHTIYYMLFAIDDRLLIYTYIYTLYCTKNYILQTILSTLYSPKFPSVIHRRSSPHEPRSFRTGIHTPSSDNPHLYLVLYMVGNNHMVEESNTCKSLTLNTFSPICLIIMFFKSIYTYQSTTVHRHSNMLRKQRCIQVVDHLQISFFPRCCGGQMHPTLLQFNLPGDRQTYWKKSNPIRNLFSNV